MSHVQLFVLWFEFSLSRCVKVLFVKSKLWQRWTVTLLGRFIFSNCTSIIKFQICWLYYRFISRFRHFQTSNVDLGCYYIIALVVLHTKLENLKMSWDTHGTILIFELLKMLCTLSYNRGSINVELLKVLSLIIAYITFSDGMFELDLSLDLSCSFCIDGESSFAPLPSSAASPLEGRTALDPQSSSCPSSSSQCVLEWSSTCTDRH